MATPLCPSGRKHAERMTSAWSDGVTTRHDHSAGFDVSPLGRTLRYSLLCRSPMSGMGTEPGVKLPRSGTGLGKLALGTSEGTGMMNG